MTPRSSSTSSERTLVENGMLPHNAAFEEHSSALLGSFSLLDCIESGTTVPPCVYEGIFGLITGNFPDPNDLLPPFEETRWGDLPHPDHFEILSDAGSGREALEGEKQEPVSGLR